VGGISLLVYHATGGAIPMAFSMLAINGVLIVLAIRMIGVSFSTKTLYAIFTMSLAMWVMQTWIPSSPEGVLGLGGDKLLSALLAGVVCGIGVSICFAQGGSAGGTDIIAMIINKYRAISYGKVIMSCDLVIIGLSYFIDAKIATIIYSLVVVGALGYTLDAVLEGSKQSSQIFIITKHYAEMARRLAEEAGRGVTLLDAQGWYSGQETKMVMVVTRKAESSNLLRIVREVDPEAFITVGSVMGVYGKGFVPLENVAKGGRKKR